MPKVGGANTKKTLERFPVGEEVGRGMIFEARGKESKRNENQHLSPRQEKT